MCAISSMSSKPLHYQITQFHKEVHSVALLSHWAVNRIVLDG